MRQRSFPHVYLFIVSDPCTVIYHSSSHAMMLASKLGHSVDRDVPMRNWSETLAEGKHMAGRRV